jgi:4-amino-4-deoxy-L-arabinose transferase-like glycosyltransferase
VAIRELPVGGMNWRSSVRVLDWAIPLGFGSILCLMAPLRTALEFGGDEGYELMKAFLVSLGHPLYREVWNDQPPLHTELLALLFWVFGPSAYVGRLLSVGFAMVVVGGLYKNVSHRSGRVAGLLAVALLVSSSYFLQLSVSVMIELPAMALALASVWAWSNYFAGKGKRWLMFSGVLFGCALQVKLTAAIFLPALAVEYLVRRIGCKRKADNLAGNTTWSGCRDALVWCGAGLAAFGVILVVFYPLDALSVFWESHFSAATRNAVAPEGYGFRPESLLNELALLAPAAVGVVLIGCKRRWDLLFPMVLLATALVIYLWHRPYWYYYGLHFAIPLAWLGAVGIVEWFRAIWKQDIWASLAAKLRVGIGWLGWSLVVSLVLTLAPEKVWNELMRLSAAFPALEDPRVLELKRHAARTHWIFTDRVIYAFWAGLPVPPELAVIPSKRIWSGQISETEVVECLERYRPEQILLLSDWEKRFGLSDYIRAHYQSDPAGEVGGLYLRK